ncbi:MAG: endonuclease/exonuclease/phosphatase family protein [Anaerolineales bacterium]
MVLGRKLSTVVTLMAVTALVLTAVPLAAPPAHADGHTPIYEIQGAGHISPHLGQLVTTKGVVTTVAFNGYYVQDPTGDGDPATSDGMFVFKFGSKPAVGDLVELTGTVEEHIPGGAGTGNLSITQMAFPTISVLSSGNALPDPEVIGTSGRIPPAVDVISDDELPVNLQLEADDAANTFDPNEDGIDFYESLEGMLVTVESPVAVSATRTFGRFSSEMFVLPNNGSDAIIEPDDARTARGGINLQPHPDNRGDQNPERVQLQFDASIGQVGTLYPAEAPVITVGDTLADVTGVVGYSFGNFEVNVTQEVVITPGGLAEESSSLVGTNKLVTVASYNVLNLSPLALDDDQRATLASHIVDNLGSPDVVALQEIQDNNGDVSDYPDFDEDDPDNPGNDGTTAADQTLQALVDAIAAAGGPTYAFFDVAPEDGTSGGIPGGNLRNAFLYNPDRVELEDFVSLTPDVLAEMGVSNPDAFDGTRDPLVGTFKFRGKEFTVVNNHLSSRFGSTPVFGAIQPFVQAGESDREAQVGALNEAVDLLLDEGRGNQQHASKAARVMVVGDLNTFEFTNDLTSILPGPEEVLNNLVDTLTDDNVYTFNFEGNSQVLDHFFVTDNLLDGAEFDIVHVNVDFPRVDDTVGSDHEPLLARFDLHR